MSTRFELPILLGNAGKWLRANATETGYIWDTTPPPPLGGYFYVQEEGVSLPQQPILNFLAFFNISDNPGNTSTDVALDVTAIANDTTFIDALIANTYFLSSLANSTDFIDYLIANTYFTTNLALDTNFIDTLIANTYFTTNLALDTNFYTTLATNNLFVDSLISNTYFTTNLANDNNFITNLTNNSTFQTLVNIFVTSGGGTNLQMDQTPDNGTYGLLIGAVDGFNDTYTVSTGLYLSGRLEVFLNGLIQLQGAGITDDWKELVPGSGTFQFNTPPQVGDIITVIYQVTAVVSAQTGIQFENEGTNLGTAGTVDEVDFTGEGVTASRAGDKVTVNVPGTVNVDGVTITGDGSIGNPLVSIGGGGSLGTGNQFLPIGQYRQTGPSTFIGDEFSNCIFRDTGTNRIYALFDADPGNFVRIFKNDYGSYYQENQISVSYLDLSEVDIAYQLSVNSAKTSWCTDGTYLYAMIRYTKSSGGDKTRIDVVRYDLDGTNPLAANIYTANSTTNTDQTAWYKAGTDPTTEAICVVGTDLYVTRSIYNGGIGDYEMKIQKYAITNPAFALALITTYAVASAGAANSGRSMTYNSYNSTFYINGVEAGTGVFEKIQKFNISGANFVAGAFTSYDEFMYFGTACTESNYSICNLEFPDASSYTIFVTQFMKEDWYTGTSSRKGIAYWLTTYQYPIF